MIYFSSTAFAELSAVRAVERMVSIGVSAVELSAGPYEHRMLDELRAMSGTVCLQPHNYFPPPRDSFVFNLASEDEGIASASMDMAKNGIVFAAELGRDVYSLHAGFLLDPEPAELGGVLAGRPLADRQRAISRFVKRLNRLSDIAAEYGIILLVENNPFSAFHLSEFGTNPFLMVTAGEVAECMKATPQNVKLLADVGHLNVSAATLGFDASEWLQECDQWIGGYHLNENNGITDTHDPLNRDSWFLNYLRPDLGYYTLELRFLNACLVKEQLAILKEHIQHA